MLNHLTRLEKDGLVETGQLFSCSAEAMVGVAHVSFQVQHVVLSLCFSLWLPICLQLCFPHTLYHDCPWTSHRLSAYLTLCLQSLHCQLGLITVFSHFTLFHKTNFFIERFYYCFTTRNMQFLRLSPVIAGQYLWEVKWVIYQRLCGLSSVTKPTCPLTILIFSLDTALTCNYPNFKSSSFKPSIASGPSISNMKTLRLWSPL